MENEQRILDFLKSFDPYYINALIVVGIIGNTFAFYIFIFTKLKNQPACAILSALTVSDNLFLVSLFFANIKHVKIDPFNQYTVFCKLTVYFTYVSSFLSSWYVVLFNIERLIGVLFPFKSIDMCSRSRNLSVVFTVFIFALTFYSVTLFTSGVEHHDDEYACVTLRQWFSVAKILTFVDVIITMFVPFLFIFLSNLLIILKLMDARRLLCCKICRPLSDQNNNFADSRSNSLNRSNSNSSCPSLKPQIRASKRDCQNQNEVQLINLNNRNSKKSLRTDVSLESSALTPSQRHKRGLKYAKTTRTLIIISFTFLLLHAPIAYLKVRYYYKSGIDLSLGSDKTSLEKSSGPVVVSTSDPNFNISMNGQDELKSSDNNNQDNEANYSDEILERLTCYIYYLNFSLNFFLYVLSGSNFRKTFFNIFKCKKL